MITISRKVLTTQFDILTVYMETLCLASQVGQVKTSRSRQLTLFEPAFKLAVNPEAVPTVREKDPIDLVSSHVS